MNKIKRFFTEAVEKAKTLDVLLSSIKEEEEHILLKSLSTDPVELPSSLEVKSVPSTFIKTFVYDYVEDIDKKVNTYAEDNKLEIKSILVNQTNLGVLYATVLFERSVESGG